MKLRIKQHIIDRNSVSITNPNGPGLIDLVYYPVDGYEELYEAIPQLFDVIEDEDEEPATEPEPAESVKKTRTKK